MDLQLTNKKALVTGSTAESASPSLASRSGGGVFVVNGRSSSGRAGVQRIRTERKTPGDGCTADLGTKEGVNLLIRDVRWWTSW